MIPHNSGPQTNAGTAPNDPTTQHPLLSQLERLQISQTTTIPNSSQLQSLPLQTTTPYQNIRAIPNSNVVVHHPGPQIIQPPLSKPKITPKPAPPTAPIIRTPTSLTVVNQNFQSAPSLPAIPVQPVRPISQTALPTLQPLPIQTQSSTTPPNTQPRPPIQTNSPYPLTTLQTSSHFPLVTNPVIPQTYPYVPTSTTTDFADIDKISQTLYNKRLASKYQINQKQVGFNNDIYASGTIRNPDLARTRNNSILLLDSDDDAIDARSSNLSSHRSTHSVTSLGHQSRPNNASASMRSSHVNMGSILTGVQPTMLPTIPLQTTSNSGLIPQPVPMNTLIPLQHSTIHPLFPPTQAPPQNQPIHNPSSILSSAYRPQSTLFHSSTSMTNPVLQPPIQHSSSTSSMNTQLPLPQDSHLRSISHQNITQSASFTSVPYPAYHSNPLFKSSSNLSVGAISSGSQLSPSLSTLSHSHLSHHHYHHGHGHHHHSPNAHQPQPGHHRREVSIHTPQQSLQFQLQGHVIQPSSTPSGINQLQPAPPRDLVPQQQYQPLIVHTASTQAAQMAASPPFMVLTRNRTKNTSNPTLPAETSRPVTRGSARASRHSRVKSDSISGGIDAQSTDASPIMGDMVTAASPTNSNNTSTSTRAGFAGDTNSGYTRPATRSRARVESSKSSDHSDTHSTVSQQASTSSARQYRLPAIGSGKQQSRRRTRRNTKVGCQCKQSGCVKRYCACFSIGRMCTDSCRCCIDGDKCYNTPQYINLMDNLDLLNNHLQSSSFDSTFLQRNRKTTPNPTSTNTTAPASAQVTSMTDEHINEEEDEDMENVECGEDREILFNIVAETDSVLLDDNLSISDDSSQQAKRRMLLAAKKHQEILANQSKGQDNVTCNCSKGCNKNYCICFSNGFACLTSCRCLDCRNTRDYSFVPNND